MSNMGRIRFRYYRGRTNGGGNGFFLFLLAIFCAFMAIGALLDASEEQISLIIILIFSFVAIIGCFSRDAPQATSISQKCVLQGYSYGGLNEDYFYTDTITDSRGDSLTHLHYTATKIFPQTSNFVVAIRVRNERKEYFFTKKAISNLHVEFFDERPGSILLTIRPCYFELGDSPTYAHREVAQSAHDFADFIMKCAGFAFYQ